MTIEIAIHAAWMRFNMGMMSHVYNAKQVSFFSKKLIFLCIMYDL